jgi:uncharacterized protein YneF (UPF0154 family)
VISITVFVVTLIITYILVKKHFRKQIDKSSPINAEYIISMYQQAHNGQSPSDQKVRQILQMIKAKADRLDNPNGGQ